MRANVLPGPPPAQAACAVQRSMKLTHLKPRVGVLGTRLGQSLATRDTRITGAGLQKIRDRIFRRDSGLCQCDECQAPGVLPRIGEVVDHRVPLWEGGSDTDDNRQLLARTCHDKKSAAETKRRHGG